MIGSRAADIVVIGASLGGLDALEALLAAWHPCPPVAIVQHRRMIDETTRLLDLLGHHSVAPVVEVEDRTPLVAGRVHLGPADYHVLVERGRLTLSTDAPVRHARPSIDVLFESAADAYGAGVVGVVLTGASDDGAAGAAAIRAHGGRLLVQDPATALSAFAPRAAIARCGADAIFSLDEIAAYLDAIASRPGSLAS